MRTRTKLAAAGAALTALTWLPAPPAEAAAYQYIWICNSSDSTTSDPIVARSKYSNRTLYRGQCEYAYNGDEGLRVTILGKTPWQRKNDWGGGNVDPYGACTNAPSEHNPDNRAYRVYYKRSWCRPT